MNDKRLAEVAKFLAASDKALGLGPDVVIEDKASGTRYVTLEDYETICFQRDALLRENESLRADANKWQFANPKPPHGTPG